LGICGPNFLKFDRDAPTSGHYGFKLSPKLTGNEALSSSVVAAETDWLLLTTAIKDKEDPNE
ncbi:MAG: hypothetical protein ABFS02_14610, partial [Pseudomonadota bacterium]